MIELVFKHGRIMAEPQHKYRVIDSANVVSDKLASTIAEGDIIGGKGRVLAVRQIEQESA